MDVHRSRFVPYPVSAITAVSFTRSSDSGFTGPLPPLRLALGRANGTIEIWNPQRGAWVQETVFHCAEENKGAAIDDLVWTQDPDDTDSQGQTVPGQYRLFSIASSPAVSEWDLVTGTLKKRSTGNFSEVWSFAAQPRWRAGVKAANEVERDEASRAQDIVVGCGDGAIVLLSTADKDLQFKKVIVRVSGKKARCMSLAYQTRDRVVAGFADSMIRVYDTRNGTSLVNMGLGIGIPGAPRNALVWKVRCLPNGDIVSGDSNGEIRIWDGKMYSQLQRLMAHDTDCLDLVTGADGKTILSGSMDGKLAAFRMTKDGQGRRIWAKTGHRRVHQGEVKAMAAFDSKSMSIVVSGGADGGPTVTPLREYGRENLRTLPSLPQVPPVTTASKARLLVSWWDTDIYIWSIAAQSTALSVSLDREAPRKLVSRITLKSGSIRDVSISDDGKLVAAATNSGLRVFQLRRRADEDKLNVRKVDLPKELSKLTARLVEFSPNGKWLTVVTTDSEVCIVRTATDVQNPKRMQILGRVVELDRQHRKQAHSSAFKGYDRTITRLAFSPDSNVLVASDLSGFLDSWVLQGNEDITAAAVDVAKHTSDNESASANSDSDSSDDSDSDDEEEDVVFYGQHWTDNPAGHLLPKLDSAPLVLTFRPNLPPQKKGRRRSSSMVNGNPGVHATRHNPHAHSHELPSGPQRLWCMTARHHMYELDVLEGKLSDWSRRNPSSVLPDDFTKIRERVIGCVWDSSSASLTPSDGTAAPQRLWLYGSNFLFMLDVSGDLSDGTAAPPPTKKRRRKAKRADSEAGEDQEDEDEAEERTGNVRKMMKLESGAGNIIRGGAAGIPTGATRIEDGKSSAIEFARDVSKPDEEGEDEDDDEDDDDDDALLARLHHDSDNDDSRKTLDAEPVHLPPRKWWCTFKYRPILGMAPLENTTLQEKGEGEGGKVENGTEDEVLAAVDRVQEVVLVERPWWDVQRDRERSTQ